MSDHLQDAEPLTQQSGSGETDPDSRMPEELTVWDVLVAGIRAPRKAWRLFWAEVTSGSEPAAQAIHSLEAGQLAPPATAARAAEPAPARVMRPVVARELALPLGLMLLGVALGLVGSLVMASGINRSEARELRAGAPWLLLGFGLWLVAAFLLYREDLRRWWRRRQQRESAEADHAALSGGEALPWAGGLQEWLARISPRLSLAGVGLLLSAGAYLFNGGNQFTVVGVAVWWASVIVWLMALAPDGWTWQAALGRWRARLGSLARMEVRLRLSWTALALLAIMLVAAIFRLTDLSGVPPEMTSDHVEKLLDAQRVLDGTTQVFFPNNGGREAVQMYLVALFSVVSGLGMQFLTLKLVSVLEGLITIPVLWWMGREIIGEDQPRLGNAVGLILAALVAVSYWHVALSRLALRIVLTPLIMALVLIYLARGMRSNRRADFLKAGLALGIGVYCYQAVRMIPVVVVLGVGLAFLFKARNRAARLRYVLNLAALVVVAVAIFVPLGRFMVDSPNLFWMRTAGRLFGDDVIMETDPVTGVITERDATMEDRINAFRENLPVLSQNIRNVLLMFNWKGDVAWINGAPNRPAMDPVTGTFFVLGIAAWLVRMVRRRDVVDWLILPGMFIMLLPSALSIAFPVENPSATRTSGALPFAYLLAAYGLATMLLIWRRTLRGRMLQAVGIGGVVVAVVVAYAANSALYFGEYRERYQIAALPYSQAGQILRGFAESNGSYGNAFMVAYPYWFDHRAIGIEGGRIDWPNGLHTLDELPDMIRANAGTRYAFDPGRAVLFFYHAADTETAERLQEWFPQGNSLLQTTDMAVKDFYTFIAPPPGEAWLEAFLAAWPEE
ncbi:MAG: hypothetical protein Kow0077_05440 [Anaerolineae bacterium]